MCRQGSGECPDHQVLEPTSRSDLLRTPELREPDLPDEVGVKMRDEAIAFVRQGFDQGKWSQWADAHLLIEEQDEEDEPAPEGLEAYSHFAVDDR